MGPKYKKRTWYYLLKPADYEICCNHGGTLNKDHKIEWSEFESMIWCFDCKLDMTGFGGIFDGPIGSEATKMILGDLCFHRFNMVKRVIEAPVRKGSKIFYRACPALTKKLIKS